MIYLDMLRHWGEMLGGNSYWHLPQGIGREFKPGTLRGYFNDLTGKASWPGPVDEAGMPLNYIGGSLVYYPITVLQKGLAHWDLHLDGGLGAEAHRRQFDAVVRWIIDTQDNSGGWAHATPLHPNALSKYSCMAQAEAASILVRSWTLTRDERSLEAAHRGLAIMLGSISEGGCAIYEGDSLRLEEYPSPEKNTVLNGWIFGIYGIYDFLLAAHDAVFEERLERTVCSLVTEMARFDCGYWSLYDVSGTLASPFYHRLHVAQLKALARTFPQHCSTFQDAATRFEQYSTSRINQACAIVRKVAQRLVRPNFAVLHTK